jgi:hypothetical protein
MPPALIPLYRQPSEYDAWPLAPCAYLLKFSTVPARARSRECRSRRTAARCRHGLRPPVTRVTRTFVSSPCNRLAVDSAVLVRVADRKSHSRMRLGSVYTYLEYEFTDHVFGVPPEQGDTLMGRSFQSSVQVSCRIQCEYLYVSIHRIFANTGGIPRQLVTCGFRRISSTRTWSTNSPITCLGCRQSKGILSWVGLFRVQCKFRVEYSVNICMSVSTVSLQIREELQ